MTAIEWTDATWNPVTGCSKVSPGCAHCYAETLSLRFGWSKKPWTPENAAENIVLHPERLRKPLSWREPRMVFVNSMSDLFHEQIPYEFIRECFNTMRCCDGGIVAATGKPSPRHTFQVLTKRPERALELWRERKLGFETWPDNIWLGVSIENMRWVGRADVLREIPAAVRFISAEPLLGPLVEWMHCGHCVDWPYGECDECESLRYWPSMESLNLSGIDWLIVGGESGPGPGDRKLVERCTHVYEDTGKVDRANCGLCHGTGWRVHPWARDEARRLQDLTHAAGGAYFLKQFGGPRPGSAGHLLDGVEYQEFPAVRGS
jgi:protein gp37